MNRRQFIIASAGLAVTPLVFKDSIGTFTPTLTGFSGDQWSPDEIRRMASRLSPPLRINRIKR